MGTSVNRQRGMQNVRSWNELFPPGTKVLLAGDERLTWSWAGLGRHWEPVVWLVGTEEPVPLSHLEVPGWVFGPRTGKG
jgi:hypothetical protein